MRPAIYDTIGVNYSDLRKPDSRIERVITDALGSAKTVLNVGAGTGSYEPTDRAVIAVEPSVEMIQQRGASASPVVRGYAENLPFDDAAFDASMAVLTVHHWTDKENGLKELCRVAQDRVVILTFDPLHQGYWLADYIPELVTLDQGQMPRMTDFEHWIGPVEVTPVPIPYDCTDGFLGAYWRRPAAHLDPKIRAAISSFWVIQNVSEKLDRLAADLDSGAWVERYSDLLELDDYDFGYRLVTKRF